MSFRAKCQVFATVHPIVRAHASDQAECFSIALQLQVPTTVTVEDSDSEDNLEPHPGGVSPAGGRVPRVSRNMSLLEDLHLSDDSESAFESKDP